MKKLFYFSSLLAILFISSCKKDDVDPRDVYVGTYNCSQRELINSLGYNETYTFSQAITKSTSNSNQILFNDPDGGSESWAATVNGSSYTYEVNAYTDEDGITTTRTGSGSINGKVITEQGTLKISLPNGQTYTGTWSNVMNRQ